MILRKTQLLERMQQGVISGKKWFQTPHKPGKGSGRHQKYGDVGGKKGQKTKDGKGGGPPKRVGSTYVGVLAGTAPVRQRTMGRL